MSTAAQPATDRVPAPERSPAGGPPTGLRAAFAAGVTDVRDGLGQWRLWYLMGSADMRRRYARSRLGQLWIMISSAVMVVSIGLVWSYLWKQPIAEMLPYVGISLVIWQLVSGALGESTTALINSAHYFHNQYVAASTILIATLYRHAATFALNLILPLVIALGLGWQPTASLLLAPIGLLLVLIFLFWASFIIALICTRFRDLIQLVSNVLQVAVYITPVFWKPEALPVDVQPWVMLNPFAILIAVVRDPLLGRAVPDGTWTAALALSFGGFALALPIIGRYRRRLVYWL